MKLIIVAVLVLPALHYALLASGLTQVAAYMTDSAATLQAIIYLGLAGIFGLSLRKGHVPVITRIATFTRGELSPELLAYTRRVTIAWCIFCLAQVVTPQILLAFAPRAVWAFYVTTLNLPLLAAMATGEYAWRRIRYSHLSHESPAEMLRLMKQFRGLIRP